MRIRRAVPADFPRIRDLAGRENLDYDDMEKDLFWVAVEGEEILGACGLTCHPDCLELRSLAVDERHRGKGIGSSLAAAVLEAAGREVYLTTILPKFFESAGFRETADIPPSMVKDEAWCAGCRRDLCRVMVGRR